MRQELADGMIFRFEFFVGEHRVYGVMTILTNRKRYFAASTSRDQVVVGGAHIGPFAQGAGVDGINDAGHGKTRRRSNIRIGCLPGRSPAMYHACARMRMRNVNEAVVHSAAERSRDSEDEAGRGGESVVSADYAKRTE